MSARWEEVMHRFRLFLTAAVLAWLATSGFTDEIKDTESATHAEQAAAYSVVETYSYPGFKVVQVDLAVLSHYSYLLCSGPDCLVVDPGREVGFYVERAKELGARIAGVYLTHSHADFVAGHIELAKQFSVPVYINAKAGAGYRHKPLKEGDRLEVGDAVVRFLETPGHTPDGMCALVAAKNRPDEPLLLFSGDTLFVGSVGRPDLIGGDMSAARLASMLFDTWNDKLSRLPDDVVIYPAHGAGSLCGAHLSDEPFATLGEQRTANPYLRHTSRGEFIAAVLDGLPEAPQYFGHNAAMNRKGPELVEWKIDKLPLVEPSRDLADPARTYLVDVREAAAYARAHVPNSVNIGLRGRFETWTGIMVPWASELVLVGSEKELFEALRRLHRVGYDARCLSLEAWKAAGLPLTSSRTVKPRELHAAMQTRESPVVVDVRLPKEWMALRIGTVVNLPLNELAKRAATLDRNEAVVAVCNSAYRSSLAVGVLERLGFAKAASMEGGAEAWIEAGLPVFEAKTKGGVATAKRVIQLAERISAAELKRLMLDLPGTFALVDIRPPEHFEDFHLPQALNVDIADLLNNPAYLTGAGPLVIVDRDGTLAMMVAGILSQKTQRPIKALFGGLQAYWAEAGPAVAPPAGRPAAAPAPKSTPPPAAPAKKKKKKSAGC
jgi:glyoxylase-like metal-dependent hydrolase (beta-lactamase superfamily II)/rhodanese-related sulfurtransferase